MPSSTKVPGIGTTEPLFRTSACWSRTKSRWCAWKHDSVRGEDAGHSLEQQRRHDATSMLHDRGRTAGIRGVVSNDKGRTPVRIAASVVVSHLQTASDVQRCMALRKWRYSHAVGVVERRAVGCWLRTCHVTCASPPIFHTTPESNGCSAVPFMPWCAYVVFTYLPSSGASSPHGVPPARPHASATGALPGEMTVINKYKLLDSFLSDCCHDIASSAWRMVQCC